MNINGWDQIYWECQRSIERARWGYLLANGQLDVETAKDILVYCRPIAGWYPLDTLCVEDVMEATNWKWANPEAEIMPLVEEACERVSRKWDSDGNWQLAVDFALDLVGEYAAEAGIELIEAEQTDEEEA